MSTYRHTLPLSILAHMAIDHFHWCILVHMAIIIFIGAMCLCMCHAMTFLLWPGISSNIRESFRMAIVNCKLLPFPFAMSQISRIFAATITH